MNVGHLRKKHNVGRTGISVEMSVTERIDIVRVIAIAALAAHDARL